MSEADLGKILQSCKYTVGQACISDMKNNMWAVVATNSRGTLIASRNFAYTDTTKKVVWKRCAEYYKRIKECLYQRKLDMIEALDDL